MLAQVADSQQRMVNHLALFQFLVSQQDSKQCRLAGTISSDEADFDIINKDNSAPSSNTWSPNRFVGVANLNQYSHS